MIAYCILAVFIISMVLVGLLPQDGRIGHDYYHAIPRLTLGAIHFWQNGFSLPQFTPSLCGGIPLLADPQSYYFSLPQLLSFVVDPYEASLLTIALFYALGFWGAFRLGSKGLGLSVESSALAAVLFTLNGFSFANLFVGHLTHYSYLLFPWLIALPLEGLRTREVSRFLSFTLLWIYCIFGGAIHIAVVFAFGLLLFLPFLKKRSGATTKMMVAWFGGALSLALLCCAAKIVSAYLYSAQFVTRPIDAPEGPLWITWLRYFWFIPSHTPQELHFSGIVMGAWEFVGFTSKLTIAGLIAWLFRRREIDKRLCLTTMAIAVLIILVGYGQPLNRFLPFLAHYHNPIKIWSCFIPLFCLITASAFDRLAKGRPEKTRRLLLLIMLAAILGEFNSLSGFFVKTGAGISFPYESDRYYNLKKIGKLPPVLTVVNDPTMDFLGIPAGFSSLQCYEPLFGYDRKGMHSTVVPGPAQSVSAGYFNLNHPGCFLYPEHFHCRAWDRIPSSYRQQFEAFRNGEAVFEIPLWHRLMYAIDLLLILGLCLGTLVLLGGAALGRQRCYFSRPTI